MSGFDHDAAGRRGVERQDAVRRELQTLFSLMDKRRTGSKGSTGPTPAREFLLAMELFKRLRGNGWKFLDRTLQDKEISPTIPAAASVARRHFARFAKSDEEYNWMMLDLAQKLLGGATADIVSAFMAWESKTFREGANI